MSDKEKAEESVETLDELDLCLVCDKQKAVIWWTCLDCHECAEGYCC